jgi:hypothetical protein
MFPDETNPTYGSLPSLLIRLLGAVKLCRVVKVCAAVWPGSIKPVMAVSANTRKSFFIG